jgi:hypothetical protein
MSERQASRLDHLANEVSTVSLQAWVASHDVQFYESDEFLFGSVAEYLATGVRLGQPIVVIASGAHRKGYREAMRARGADPDDLIEGRDMAWLDARETLSAFMEGGQPNAELFHLTVGQVFEALRRNRPYVMIRAHGEMVDILWREGKADAALAVERMWNDLANRHAFSLLCTYSRQTLANVIRVDGVEEICGCHARVLPSEASIGAWSSSIPSRPTTPG